METTKIVCTGSIKAKIGDGESMKLANNKKLFAVIVLYNSDPVPMDPKIPYVCEKTLVMTDSKTAFIFDSVSRLKPTHKTRISFNTSFKESEGGVIEVIPGPIEAWSSKKETKPRREIKERRKPLFSFLRAKKECREVQPVEEKKIGEETVEESKEETTAE